MVANGKEVDPLSDEEDSDLEIDYTDIKEQFRPKFKRGEVLARLLLDSKPRSQDKASPLKGLWSSDWWRLMMRLSEVSRLAEVGGMVDPDCLAELALQSVSRRTGSSGPVTGLPPDINIWEDTVHCYSENMCKNENRKFPQGKTAFLS
ncbi:uncharacterized protein PGTG_06760 [Puccinia graminis f. sp. tritici CRL 75-36-700-3]|uniref:Uncharacterized protein n=1 Tax=Puccinia graminis f. sp. tritici (strain CRL 75-36-700-3 / race SCCL) TaxID=418459 RepID=E3K8Y5_PUCGT|nr:uncharacterized protein PGTG_06760 [Puccinia graminis f. sp. tritici CRL 75-36-700-3]EFP80804.1 hypothetical protein PGTG_06760 [Puccinia graminis f. sp. tritici CRL 75-36-700-3]